MTSSSPSPFSPLTSLRSLVCALLAILALMVPSVQGQIIVSDSTEDALLQAIDEAAVTGDPVIFSEDSEIMLSAPISLSSDLILDAQGHTVTLRGDGSVQLFNLQPDSPISVTLIGLTLTGGHGTQGGALYLNAQVSAVLTNCTLSGNSAEGDNGADGADGATDPNGDGGSGGSGRSGVAASGGAIYNLGNLSLFNCALVTNSAFGGNGGSGGNGGNGAGFMAHHGGNGGNGGAGGAAYGGAVCNLGTLTLHACTVAGNSVAGGSAGAGGEHGSGMILSYSGSGAAGGAAAGAGLYSRTGLTASNCSFWDNVASGGDSVGGGTASRTGPSGPDGAAGLGGGAYSVGGITAITNCTFSNNRVNGGNGGDGGVGMDTFQTGGNGGNGGTAGGGACYSSGTVFVENCTVANCAALGGTNGIGGGGLHAGASGNRGLNAGGGLAAGSGRFVLLNSLRPPTAPVAMPTGLSPMAGYNLSSDSTFTVGGTSRANVNPRLGPLAFNGGPVPTMALATNSPAVDWIKGSDALARLPATDGRGVPRPLGAGGDVGAFELALAPYITTQPLSQIGSNGNSVLFAVEAAGSAPLTYSWRFRGTNFYFGTGAYKAGNTNFASSTASNLRVQNLSITNAGTYCVVVANSSGAVTSSPAVLNIAPYIVADPTNSEVGHQQPTFAVTAAADQPMTYYWYLNETNLVQVSSSQRYMAPAPAQAADDGSTYNVVVSNAFGSVTSALASVQVDLPPVLLVQPASQVVGLGAQFTFEISAAGHPPLYYQWRLDGNNVAANPLIPNPDAFPAQTNNEGLWDVVITNAYGAVTSAPAYVTVVTAPPTNVLVSPSSLSVTQGQTASFTASATGRGLSWQWRFNGTPISGATSNNLSLGHVQFTQAGNYDVVVSNPLGAVPSAPPAALSVALPELNLTNWVSTQVPGFRALGVAVAGNYAYLAMAGTNAGGAPGRLQVVDITDPLHPLITNSLALPGPGLSLFVSGARAFVACGSAGLQVADLTDPAGPVAGRSYGSGARAAFVSGQFAYVAAGANGFQLFDVSSTSAPDPVGTVTTNLAGASSIWVSGDYAYVGDDATGLNVVKVSNPSSPQWLTNVSTGSPVRGIVSVGVAALAVATDAGLEIAGIDKPSAPGLFPVDATAAPAIGLAYSANYVFVASATNGLRAFNVTNPVSPQPFGTAAISSANGVDVSGRYVYVATDDALVVLDAGDALENGPRIRTQPQDTTVAPGSVAVLSVSAGGTAPLSFQWSRDGSPLTDSASVLGTTGPVLTIAGARLSDAGSYSVVVSNSAGIVASQSAQLSVVCAYVLDSDSANLPSLASTSSFLVAAAGPCDWTATASDSWLHILSPVGASNGNATVRFCVDANQDSFERSGSIYVGTDQSGSLFTVNQAGVPAVYTLTVNSANSAGSVSLVTVTASPPDNQGVTNGFAGTMSLLQLAYDEGTTVTLTAPTSGTSLFQEWQIDGLSVTSDPTVQVVMDGDHTATAIYSPFTPGTYTGLFYDTNGVSPDSAGFFVLGCSAKGAFSGYLQIGLTRYPIANRFDGTGAGKASNVVPRRNPSSVSVDLVLDPSDNDKLLGTVTLVTTNGVVTAQLAGDRAYFNGRTLVPSQAGQYTMVFPGNTDSPDQPGGDGYAVLSISSKGVIRMGGLLADGAKIAQAAYLSKDGFWPFFVPLYRGGGTLLGWLTLTNSGDGDPNGSPVWFKPPLAKERFYNDGFVVVTNVLSSHYAVPARGSRVLNFTNADIILSGAALSAPLTNHVTLNPNSRVTSTNKAALSFNLSNGAFAGRAIDDANKVYTFSGVVLTNLNEGRGFFLGTNTSGSITFQAR